MYGMAENWYRDKLVTIPIPKTLLECIEDLGVCLEEDKVNEAMGIVVFLQRYMMGKELS